MVGKVGDSQIIVNSPVCQCTKVQW